MYPLPISVRYWLFRMPLSYFAPTLGNFNEMLILNTFLRIH